MLLVRVSTVSQLADIFTKGLHYPQWQACVEGIFGKTFKASSLRTLFKGPQSSRGIAESSGDRQGSQVKSQAKYSWDLFISVVSD
jgi:hypothetical protein